jgi:transcriptional regulator with XRE-family HTH domain
MIEELQPRLGEVLRQERLRQGLTQLDVATATGTVTEVYGRVERGDALMSIVMLRRFCMVLGVSSDKLLKLERPLEGHPMDPLMARANESPVLRRVLNRLRTWPPHKLHLLATMMKVVDLTFEK